MSHLEFQRPPNQERPAKRYFPSAAIANTKRSKTKIPDNPMPHPAPQPNPYMQFIIAISLHCFSSQAINLERLVKDLESHRTISLAPGLRLV